MSETTVEANKALVRRLVDEVVNRRDLDALDELAGQIAEDAKRWVGPFRDAFPDFTMEILDLIAEGEKVVAHFHCSGTHEGEWMAMRPRGDASSGSTRSTSSACATESLPERRRSRTT